MNHSATPFTQTWNDHLDLMGCLTRQASQLPPAAIPLLNQINAYYAERAGGQPHEEALLTALHTGQSKPSGAGQRHFDVVDVADVHRGQ